MDYPNNTTDLRKNKHLNYEERMFIQLRLQDGFTPYKIAKQLGRARNTILNEIRRGTTTQIYAKKKVKEGFEPSRRVNGRYRNLQTQ